jgi:hypothetical protein
MTLEALLARIGEKCLNFRGRIMPRKSYAQTKDKPTLARFTVRKPPAWPQTRAASGAWEPPQRFVPLRCYRQR